MKDSIVKALQEMDRRQSHELDNVIDDLAALLERRIEEHFMSSAIGRMELYAFTDWNTRKVTFPMSALDIQSALQEVYKQKDVVEAVRQRGYNLVTAQMVPVSYAAMGRTAFPFAKGMGPSTFDLYVTFSLPPRE